MQACGKDPKKAPLGPCRRGWRQGENKKGPGRVDAGPLPADGREGSGSGGRAAARAGVGAGDVAEGFGDLPQPLFRVPVSEPGLPDAAPAVGGSGEKGRRPEAAGSGTREALTSCGDPAERRFCRTLYGGGAEVPSRPGGEGNQFPLGGLGEAVPAEDSPSPGIDRDLRSPAAEVPAGEEKLVARRRIPAGAGRVLGGVPHAYNGGGRTGYPRGPGEGLADEKGGARCDRYPPRGKEDQERDPLLGDFPGERTRIPKGVQTGFRVPGELPLGGSQAGEWIYRNPGPAQEQGEEQEGWGKPSGDPQPQRVGEASGSRFPAALEQEWEIASHGSAEKGRSNSRHAMFPVVVYTTKR